MSDILYLQRALDLARRGGAHTRTNPNVGALLVHSHRIIGEGWHAAYGKAHAEVAALEAVAPPDRHLIPQSTLYVTLEPCSHHGKTPPCADRIVQEGIPRVVVGVQDPNPTVAGRGLARLRAAGVEVALAPDPAPFLQLIRPFWVNQQYRRPYLHLKWAETADGYMGQHGRRLRISGHAAQVWTHTQRARHQAILIGWGTLLADNPQLNVRLANGPNPEVVLLSPQGSLPPQLALRQTAPLVHVVNPVHGGGPEGGLRFLRLPFKDGVVALPALWEALYAADISSILVEGGAQLLTSILASGQFDELSIVRSHRSQPEADLHGPILPAGLPTPTQAALGDDTLWHWELPMQ
jgi:diaminohydroxyphosphoribosylaminopyrimidine deaminase/5-amino-6-(5-phosphoribosylamino)uracil reductase